MAVWAGLLLFLGLIRGSDAAFLNFQNCIADTILNSNPLLLQFVPLNFSASFTTSDPNYPLNVTVYGNISGIETQQPYPAPDDPQWTNPNDTVGKIVDLSPSNNKYTTLFTTFDVLSYTPYLAEPSRFCNSSIHGSCPLSPAFYVPDTDIVRLPAFSVAHEMSSSYAFTSITAILRVTSGDSNNQELACVSATITPDLGATLRGVLRYLPLVILITVGAATVFASLLSPWGSLDTFRWTSNYVRDEDLLRLVTPGFGDCLQYIQFVVLTGSLSLNYPGFYQPVVSRIGWSSLMFNESLVTHGSGTQSLVDGIYQVRSDGTHGLDQMSQLIGMTSIKDIWAGMIVWLVVIIAAIILLTQLEFASRWLYRQMTHVPAEDLRSKNWPFTAGNMIRVVFNYFILPLVSLSMFQLLIASTGPAYSVAISVILLVAVIAFTVRLLLIFSKIRSRSFLFDDFPTVLLWGPLYNTYCDDRAGFAFLPVLLNFIRGIAIGAVQPSGIAQLVLLAICEIIFVLTLNATRPFPSATSMNIYHTCFAIIRLVALLLSVAFVPSLGVSDASRGWIGYAVLLLHAAVLVFGFFLNALQTIIEVAARKLGAGARHDGAVGPTRGGLTRVFGMRQLSKRVPRGDRAARHSMASGAGILSPDMDQKSLQLEEGRVRSLSASSTQLLNQPSLGNRRMSQTCSTSPGGGYGGGRTPSTIDGASTFSGPLGTANRTRGNVSPRGVMGIKEAEAASPYFRNPRRATMDLISPKSKKRISSDELSKRKPDPTKVVLATDADAGEGPSISRGVTPVPAHRAAVKDEGEDGANDLTRIKTDYAVREVDSYYRVRGAALSSGTRKLKTGPADPTGPVSSATGWFMNIFGGKTKEKHKGFEVVRRLGAPPPGMMTPNERQSTIEGSLRAAEEELYRDTEQEPYRDNPPQARRTSRTVSAISSEPRDNPLDGDTVSISSGHDRRDIPRITPTPPLLPAIDTGGAIELPSRVGSESSKVGDPKRATVGPIPSVPRRSSRRRSADVAELTTRLPPVAASPLHSPTKMQMEKAPQKRNSYWPVHKFSSEALDDATPTTKHISLPGSSSRIPFTSTRAPAVGPLLRSARGSVGGESTEDIENQDPIDLTYLHHQQSSSALGAHAPDLRADRPSAMGYVQQHRASDHIHCSPDSPDMEGSSAEVVRR